MNLTGKDLEPDNYGAFVERINRAYLRRLTNSRDVDNAILALNVVRRFHSGLMSTILQMAKDGHCTKARAARALGIKPNSLYKWEKRTITKNQLKAKTNSKRA